MGSTDEKTYLAHVKTLLRPRAKVLDVGCGTGSDVNHLRSEGFDATGIDGSEQAVSEGRKRYNLSGNVLRVDSLPELRVTNEKYDLVLCSMVLQCIDDRGLLDSVYRLRSLVATGGFLVILVPSASADSNSVDRSPEGFRPPGQYTFFFQRLGLREIVSYNEDVRREQDCYSAQVTVFSAGEWSDLKPVEMIESVLWDDRKVNTYKFALVRALARLAGYRPKIAKWHGDGTVSVDIDEIAHLWLEYYWPIVSPKDAEPILQGPLGVKADMGFRTDLASIAAHWEKSGGLTAFKIARDKKKLSNEQKRSLNVVLGKLRSAIRQPVRYAGNQRTGKDLFAYDDGRVFLPAGIWTELSLMSRLIDDSVVIRWAEFTAGLRHQNPDITPVQVLAMLMDRPEDARDTEIARKAFLTLAESGGLECVWTGKTMNQFDVDHAIPWALWRSNDLWNLFPVDPKTNNAKRARIPSRERVVSRRIAIERTWGTLFECHPQLFLAHASKFTGATLTDLGSAERTELFGTFKDALEFTAVNRGVERW